jgi:membrane protease YdiL (CAAX protease family)
MKDRRAKPWLFFVLTFSLSWAFWIPSAALSRRGTTFPLGILFFLGGFGPSICGVIMTYRTRDRDGRRDFWRRTLDFRRIGGRWYALILLIFPLLAALSVLVEALMGGDAPSFPYLAAIAAAPWVLLYLPVIAVQVALCGPISEELGWRGYALQARYSALSASLIVGGVWSLWHVPLFFIQDSGNFYYEWGFGTDLFWLFLCRMTLISVIMTWVYNNNGRSILSAVLLHFAYNFTFSLDYPIPGSMHWSGTILTLVAVALIAVYWEPRTLSRIAAPLAPSV